MKKQAFVILFILIYSLSVKAQGRGIKIGYIDMEYILQNVPDYIEAKNQLEQKAQKWKQEIEVKKNEIIKLKESLKTERVLLTKELNDEREEEISFQETELLEYQQKRFGPKGDLVIQKSVLSQPIQDQVFTATQDIAETKKYDFIFDKSSDLTMLFAAKKFDISDQVVRVITRATKRNQLTKKQLKEEEAKYAKEDLADASPDVAERQKKLDEKKLLREKLAADKKVALEEKKKTADDKRKQLLSDKQAGKSGSTPVLKTENKEKGVTDNEVKNPNDSIISSNKMSSADERAILLANRKKAIEDRKIKILADREAARLAKEAQTKENKSNKPNN